MRTLSVFFSLFCCLALVLPEPAQAAEQQTDNFAPTRYGVGLLVGSAYDPDRFGLLIAQGQLLLDYDRVFRHAAPEALRLKLEANAGISTAGDRRGLLAVNALALYYLDRFKYGSWTPYAEAGIGLIYTDFQLAGQGLRFNFNPQLGVGGEYSLADGGALSLALRLHHISNGNLHEQNRGINSALLMIGYLF
jgi:hypothetical protein